MISRERRAIIDYLEFNLLCLVDKLEQHVDPDAVGSMYTEAAMLLVDMDNTLQLIEDPNSTARN